MTKYKGYLSRTLLVWLLAFAGSSSVWSAPQGSPWDAAYFPNIELTDQDGQKHRFYDDLIKNKVVAINFIYTHCNDSCPAETASLKQVKTILGDRVGKDIFFYSISIDPTHDTPQVLKDYAAKFRVGSGWKFLTGKQQDTELLRKKLGLFREDVEAGKLSEHSTSIMIGNESTGQWIKRSPFDEPNVLARQLGYTLSNTKATDFTRLQNYKSAEKLAKMGKGEELFRFRCASCHSLGTQDGLGPGLQNVSSRRSKDWLLRWLKAPDELLKNKDPIALSLYNRYNKILMPNLKLTDSEIESLIHYLQSN